MKSEDISQETLRSYLIGNLDGTTVDAIDELSIADQDFADRIAAEQFDLVDDWVAGRLDAGERTVFGTVLARSPTLVEKVKFARAMTAVPRVAVIERDATPGFLESLFAGILRPSYVIGGMVLLTGIGMIALLVDRQDSVTELTVVSPAASLSPQPSAPFSVQSPEASLPTTDADSKDIRPKSTARENRPKPSPEPTVRSNSLFATLVLTPPTRGAGGVPSVRIQPGTEFLQLTIQTEAESSGRYIVEIGEPSGKADWKSQAVRGRLINGRQAVWVRIPATSLKNGIRGVRLRDAAAESEILDEHVVKIDR